MALCADVAALAARIRAADRPLVEDLSPAEARASAIPFLRLQGEPEAVAKQDEREVDGGDGPIAARVYLPAGGEPLGVIVYFHGGGWVIGDLRIADAPCRALANAAQALVVSVGYRLAPEHPFPAAYDDALAATRWVAEHATELSVRSTRIAVAGDSAGGGLAAAVALTARQEGPCLAAQLLAYPVLDANFHTASYEHNAQDAVLPRSSMRWFWEQYSAHRALADEWRALPLRASDLRGAAPAFVATCEHDVLHDDGARYARRLQDAGVPVRWRDYPGLMHGALWTLGATPSARELLDDLALAAREALTDSLDLS
jgi:acetyl esterase